MVGDKARRSTAIGASLLVLSALAPGVEASHPTQICIDAAPERAYPTAGDDLIDKLSASVGATDDDHEEPHQEGCVIEDGSGSGSTVHFEVQGAGDPDASFSPESEDMSCTIFEGDETCFVEPPESSGGEQTIYAWIDFDGETVELDQDENVDDEDTDATDVVLWTWTHGDSCGEFSGCSDSLTIRYLRQEGLFEGRISGEYGCMSGRSIRVRRKRAGRDPVIGHTRAAPSGQWQLHDDRNGGRYYAVAPRTKDGCTWQRSPTIRVR